MIVKIKTVAKIFLFIFNNIILWCSNFCLNFESRFTNTRVRNGILRLLGHKIGYPVIIDRNLEVDGKLSIGDFVLIRDGCIIGANTVIEDFCTISRDVMIITGGHSTSDMSAKGAPVVLRKFSWVGARSTILPGVIIGEHAVVAAGSVVSRCVEPYWLVGGVPARPIKKLDRARVIDSTFGKVDIEKESLIGEL